ncbi:ABC transporter permease [Pelomonas sp. SE-A7]|uniref:sugar ABC transporter permease n=1 Tax=Pelomonas sp. SE-A7 TaxID=3054953 RepID=UPI00259CE364|nr:ABC transporter permease [Pelomonas sp. SE-A7]MDM4765775.1 ABC transporter permease [Pelomonas sp. SE-A7]
MKGRAPGWTRSVDWRMACMAGVLVLLALAFDGLSGGLFLTPENLYNLVQQTAVVGILATVVVLVIVARHIDLSIGSALGFVGVLIAWLIYTKQWSWPAAAAAGLGLAIAVAAYQGALTAWLGVPSFVVTLGGLMSLRGAAFLVADGKTQPISDESFLMLGGGYSGAIGPRWSWLLCALLCTALLLILFLRRRRLRKFGIAPRPLTLDLLLTLLPCALAIVFVATMNAYQIPDKELGQGLPVPVLIWIAVALLLSFIVRRTRFGRYVFALGGNPEAAALVGIPVRRVTLQLYLLLGLLVCVAAVVSVARLNAGTNSLGTGMELYVIAAAVIGGTTLAGGSGSILGSVLGALIMQTLDSGLLLLDVSVGLRMVLMGQVLIMAVVFDVLYRRYAGEGLQ